MACEIKNFLEYKKCFKLIQKKLQQQSTKYFLKEIVPVDNKLLGYLGRYFYLKGKKVDPENPTQNCDITFFLKIVPSDGTRQKNFIQQSGVFNTEIAIYTLVFPKMLNFSDKFIPKCILDMKDGFLVLENMTSKSFEMLNKFESLDFLHSKIVLETIAKFHGRSIMFEQKNQQNVYEFLKEKNINLHTPDFLMQGAINTNIEGVSQIIDFIKMDLDDKEGWEKLKKKLREEAAIYYEKIKLSEDKKVLCHTDLWSNNLLFKYDSKKNPIECCLVDFQLGRYASPALDIMIFLQFTTSRKMRKENFQKFIKIYYHSLAETLKEERLDIKNIFPWKDFLKSVEYLRFACMTASLAYMSIDLLESDTRNKGAVTHEEVWKHLSFNTGPLVLKQYQEIPYYRDRIFDSLMEFYELLAN